MALKFAVNNSLSAVTSLPTAISTGSMTLLQTQTASSSSTIDFTSNIDSTYDSYVFKFIDIHPSNDGAKFQYNFSTDGGSNYNVTKTETRFFAYHNESDTSAQLAYDTTSADQLAQSTDFGTLAHAVGNDDDGCVVGIFNLYNPSSTTFVKHFIINFQQHHSASGSYQHFKAGYGNTTSAINAVRFKMNSGTIDSGDIKLYGIS
jgi:hypothetical protein